MKKWLPLVVLLVLFCATAVIAAKWTGYSNFGSGAVTVANDELLVYDADDAEAVKVNRYKIADFITDISALIAADIAAGELADNIVGVADMTHEDHGDVTYASGAAVVEDDSHAHVYSNIDAFTEANLYTILSDVTGFIETNDAAVLTSLDTGEGANELFDMDQNVTTSTAVTFATVTTAAAADARVSFRDSQAPGSDKDMGWIQIDYVDGGDGSENADIIVASTQGGAEDTEQLRYDESDDMWETTNPFSQGSLTPVQDDCDDFASTFTGANLYGGTFVCNLAGTCQLPEMAVGMNFTIITQGAIACVVDTHANDGYLMDGTTNAEGKNLTNTSTAGDIAVFQYMDADDWLITTNGWTPEA